MSSPERWTSQSLDAVMMNQRTIRFGKIEQRVRRLRRPRRSIDVGLSPIEFCSTTGLNVSPVRILSADHCIAAFESFDDAVTRRTKPAVSHFVFLISYQVIVATL